MAPVPVRVLCLPTTTADATTPEVELGKDLAHLRVSLLTDGVSQSLEVRHLRRSFIKERDPVHGGLSIGGEFFSWGCLFVRAIRTFFHTR